MLLEQIKDQKNMFNRIYYAIHGGTMSRHTCPILSIYGHCGKSEECKHCTKGKE